MKMTAAMPNCAVAAAVDQRLAALRLDRNPNWQVLAGTLGITSSSCRPLISGKHKFNTIIEVVRTLHRIDGLEDLVRTLGFRTSQPIGIGGKPRQRARSPRETAPGQPGIAR